MYEVNIDPIPPETMEIKRTLFIYEVRDFKLELAQPYKTIFIIALILSIVAIVYAVKKTSKYDIAILTISIIMAIISFGLLFIIPNIV